MPVSLPVPVDPGIVGLELVAQGVFLDAAGAIGATAGVRLTVL